MISYLHEQPRTQALADVLRGTAATSGGTQMNPGRSNFVGSSPIPEANFDQYGSQGGGADLGQMAKKGWDVFGDDIMSLFGNAGSSGGAGIGNAAAQYGPEVAKMGGNVTSPGWMDSISSMFGGGGSSAAGSGMGSMMSAAGPIIGAVLGGLKVDDMLNESGKDKWYSADKLNDLGTINIGGKDMGFRVGDFANGINPATWLSDPKKGATGLLNAFTFGLFD